jgi:hypothetical protein
MSGVELKTVQDYQAAIQKLDKNNPADRKKIEEYCEKIGELLANKGIVEADSTKVKVEKGLGVESQNKVPSKESVSATDQFNPDVVGKKAAYANIRKAYGADKFDQARYDTLKNEIKDLDKKIKELDKILMHTQKLDKNL